LTLLVVVALLYVVGFPGSRGFPNGAFQTYVVGYVEMGRIAGACAARRRLFGIRAIFIRSLGVVLGETSLKFSNRLCRYQC
jgi:hypothetical protein